MTRTTARCALLLGALTLSSACGDSSSQTSAQLAAGPVVQCGIASYVVNLDEPQMWTDDYGSTCQSPWMRSSVPLAGLGKGDHSPAYLFRSGSTVYAADPRACRVPPSPVTHSTPHAGDCPA